MGPGRSHRLTQAGQQPPRQKSAVPHSSMWPIIRHALISETVKGERECVLEWRRSDARPF